MKISLTNAGKRFNREWIFRGASLEFLPQKRYAITGPNGSGKSTLLQSIGGMLQLSEGEIRLEQGSNLIPDEAGNKYLSFCAPYLDVIEEMTLIEFLNFHQTFKPFSAGLDTRKAIEIIGLQKAAGKQIRYFSSGMKQRVKLAQAVFSDTPVLLLDEPCSNFDTAGIDLYQRLIEEYGKSRLVIVCSNDEVEYRFCEEIISMARFK
jgi:ABC-type multidrug transport system ATPase subunit